MTNTTCGHPTADGSPCQNPATDGDTCWLDEHGGTTRDCGPPKPHQHERVLEAAQTPAKVKDIAGYAGAHRSTLTRWYACLDGLADPAPKDTVDEPCDICTEYMRARRQGIVDTLQACSPEYLASLHGYSKKEVREHELGEGTGGLVEALQGGYLEHKEEEGELDG